MDGRAGSLLAVALAALLGAALSGCVSAKEYKARVSELEGCSLRASGLEEEARGLRASNAGLSAELSGLRERHEALSREKESLDKRHADLRALLEKREGDLGKEMAALDLMVRDLEGELSDCQARASALEAGLEETEGRVAELLREKEEKIEELRGAHEELVSELKEEIKRGEVTIISLKNRLSLSMVDRILFDSGSADVKKSGREVLDRVAGVLARVPDRDIRVEGHTDDVPIGPRLREAFPTNWELSTARATNVVRYLVEAGVDPARLTAAGRSQYSPVAPNDTAEGRAKNRRIEIVLVPRELAGAEGEGPAR
ncbi:MAG: OmpA family protein [Thermodesulfovibrionales bacterium]